MVSASQNKLVSAVTDGPRDALRMLKSYQLLHETQLQKTEYAMFVLQSTDMYHRPSKLYAGLCIALTVDSPDELTIAGAINRAHLRPFLLTAPSTKRLAVAKFSKSRVLDNIAEGSALIFAVTQISLQHSVG